MQFHVPSYPKIHNLGSRYVLDIFNDEVVMEEKVDGSFFAFCKINGEYFCRSKGKQIIPDNPDKLFSETVANTKNLNLNENWIYYGEALKSPKHNCLKYNRFPKNNCILFDIDTGNQNYLPYKEKENEANRIGLEVVPLIFQGKVDNFDQFKENLKKESILGGVTIEGLVVKNYNKFTSDGKTMMAKYVSEQFKEKNSVEWKKSNPTQLDILNKLILMYKTDARILKSIQHLREQDKLTDSPKDIGNLIKEYQNDLKIEEEENIKQELFNYFWPKIMRGTVGFIPNFYKEYLAKQNFKSE